MAKLKATDGVLQLPVTGSGAPNQYPHKLALYHAMYADVRNFNAGTYELFGKVQDDPPAAVRIFLCSEDARLCVK